MNEFDGSWGEKCENVPVLKIDYRGVAYICQQIMCLCITVMMSSFNHCFNYYDGLCLAGTVS